MDETANLSPCQQSAHRVLSQTQDNIFLTGCAGSGKSFMIRKFLKGVDRKTFPVVASTGAAAVLVGGRTFHSFFGLGILEGGLERTLERALEDRRLARRLKKISGFVLDEVSMIPGEALRAAEMICRSIRKADEPWGGIRVIAVGDFSQLPPVSRMNSGKDWAFLTETWEQSELKSVVLKTVMRSEDEEYLKVLNHIREGRVDSEVSNYLDARTLIDEEERETTYLFPRRNQVNRYNRLRLEQISMPLQKIPTEFSGNLVAVEKLKRYLPIPEVLRVKEGALVMTRVNDPAYRFINGSVGILREVHSEHVLVDFPKRGEIKIEKASFSMVGPDGEIIAAATNFPLNLAYALTIHKAQGTTLDHLVTDLKGLWEPGQAYVALSRLRKGSGLTLTGWDEESILTDPQVVDFHQRLSESSYKQSNG